jgi:hypothetical protein
VIDAVELVSSGWAIGSFAGAPAVLLIVVPAAQAATSAVIVTSAVPPAGSGPRLLVTVSRWRRSCPGPPVRSPTLKS